MKIIGSGRASGNTIVSSTSKDIEIRQEPGFLERKTGMKKRCYAGPGEDQLSLGLAAAWQALDDADCAIEEIGMIISACAVPLQPIPNLSSRYAGELGCVPGRVETLDVNSTCLSFLSAFSLAEMMLETKKHSHVLIISSEIASRGLPWKDDPETAALFADGAAAVILSSGKDRILGSSFETYPEGWDFCQVKSGGTGMDLHSPDFAKGALFSMEGRHLFRMTQKLFPGFLDRLTAKAGIQAGDLDLVVPHQASPLALKHVSKALGFKDGAVLDICSETGNQISVSIPFALDLARKEGLFAPGQKVALLGTSAGVSFGGVIMETGE